MAKGPSPGQQADYLVRKLEQTIRDNRSVRGMSFATWQTIAREEITNALMAGERRHRAKLKGLAWTVIGSASALVTIGFWGAAVMADRAWGPMAATASLGGVAVLLALAARTGVERMLDGWNDEERSRRLARIEDVDRRIKRMEAEMNRKQERLKERMEGTGPV